MPVGRRVRARRPPGPVARHAGRRQRHDGRAAAAARAAGRPVPRRLLPQQPAVPVRRGRPAGGRGGPGPGAGAVRVPGRRPVVLPVHEHRGRGPGRPLGRLRGRVRGRRRGRRARRRRAAAHRRGRRRGDARARPVRLRALFVLPARHGGRPSAGRARAVHVRARRARAAGQRVGRRRGGPGARGHRPAHGRPRLRVKYATRTTAAKRRKRRRRREQQPETVVGVGPTSLKR